MDYSDLHLFLKTNRSRFCNACELTGNGFYNFLRIKFLYLDEACRLRILQQHPTNYFFYRYIVTNRTVDVEKIFLERLAVLTTPPPPLILEEEQEEEEHEKYIQISPYGKKATESRLLNEYKIIPPPLPSVQTTTAFSTLNEKRKRRRGGRGRKKLPTSDLYTQLLMQYCDYGNLFSFSDAVTKLERRLNYRVEHKFVRKSLKFLQDNHYISKINNNGGSGDDDDDDVKMYFRRSVSI